MTVSRRFSVSLSGKHFIAIGLEFTDDNAAKSRTT